MASRLPSRGCRLLEMPWDMSKLRTRRVQLPLTHQPRRSLQISASLRAKRPPPPPRPRAAPGSSAAPRSGPKPGAGSGSGAATLDVLFQEKKWPLVLSGLTALVMGAYISLVLSSSSTGGACTSPCAHPATAGPGGTPLAPTGRPAGMDAATSPEQVRQTAAAFDKEQDLPELLIGVRGLRKKLAARARGHVLEVAVGTGRNLPFYDWTEVVAADEEQGRGERERARVRTLLERHSRSGSKGVDVEKERLAGRLDGEVLTFTGLDISADMLGVARERLRDAVPGLKAIVQRGRAAAPAEKGTVVDLLDGRIRLVMADAQQPLAEPPGVAMAHGGKYDTIVQTFGLCSVEDPTKLLASMASKVQPGSGRILLLEHGRGWLDWMNERLDSSAEKHFQRYGCWWNRDIEKIVRDAEKTIPGLEVVKVDRPGRFQFGTTLLIELKVNRSQP